DSVREVLEVETARIDPPPRMGTGIRADFIRGICRQDERFLLILDAAKVFTTDEVLSLDELGAQPGPAGAGASAHP
ncbi:chemotaxis protein CheW, partial [Megalodesulfovibrio gigas]